MLKHVCKTIAILLVINEILTRDYNLRNFVPCFS